MPASSEENHTQRRPLPARRTEPEEEENRITKSDLRQRVLEREIVHLMAHRPQKDAQRGQQQRPPESMQEHLANVPPLAIRLAIE